jgi:hypothetical protein
MKLARNSRHVAVRSQMALKIIQKVQQSQKGVAAILVPNFASFKVNRRTWHFT